MTLTIDRARRRTLLAEAIATLEVGGFATTDAVCASLLVADPEDLDALLLRSLALAALGHVAPAARLLNGVAEARFAHAHPCRDLDGMLGAAEFATQVRACLALAPDDVRLRLMWADWLQRVDDLAGPPMC